MTHFHPCQRCGESTSCFGELERNYDGFPDVICPDFHFAGGSLNPRFLCQDCEQEPTTIPQDERSEGGPPLGPDEDFGWPIPSDWLAGAALALLFLLLLWSL